MCGIAGGAGAPDLGVVRRMLDRMAHRGPDGQAARAFSASGQSRRASGVLGHARLAIVDPGGGAQPLGDEAGATWVVTNGEIFNHEALRRRLAQDGHRWRSGSDAEAAVHLMEQALDRAAVAPASRTVRAVASAVARLDGMFALAAWRSFPHGGGALVLARDPIGIRPLYWGPAPEGGTWYFASEVKAVRAACGSYEEFPPGGVALFRVGQDGELEGPTVTLPERPAYIPRRPVTCGDDEEAVSELDRRLGSCVSKWSMSDVPYGIALSGGLDSSLVAALAVRGRERRLSSFAVGAPGSPDLEAARTVASALGTLHHERVLSQRDVASLLPAVIYHLESFDAPLVRSAVANYALFELAGRHVRVVLTGEGSDELFAGYESLRDVPDHALNGELARLVGALHNTNLQRSDRMGLAHGVEARVPFLDVEFVRWALGLDVRFKRRRAGGGLIDKWVVRELARRYLPEWAAARPKAKFSHGSGASKLLASLVDGLLTDREWRRLESLYPGVPLRSKEEALYFRAFVDHFPDEAARRATAPTERTLAAGEVA